MAPDIDSMPPSPYRPRNISTSSAPRSSSELGPPATSSSQPSSYTHSPTLPFREPLSSSTQGNGPTLDNTGVGTGPGPLRHPRPLTAADLHMQLEKEQEAVVNRLTRELSLLRQQSASVASTTSSTSTGLPDPSEQSANTGIMGMGHSQSSHRHRSSSSFGSRYPNAPQAGPANNATATNALGSASGISGASTSGIAPPRDTTVPHVNPRDPLSRQSSIASRRSEASSPSLSSSLIQSDHFPTLHTRRLSGSVSQMQHTLVNLPNSGTPNPRSSQVAVTPRYEETAQARLELESVKKENEELKGRIRELERALRHRQSASEQSRSMSVSTNASLPIPGPQDRITGNEDEPSHGYGTTGP